MAWLGNIPSLLCLLFILQSYEIALNGVAATDAVPNTAVNGSANQVEHITSPPYNCLVQWLILAGASPTEAQTYATSPGVVKFHLDELKISTLGDIVLELLLSFNSRLVNNLKTCVARNATCPTDLASVTLPCGEGGRCRHSSRYATPTCVCPLGLTEQQCQSDIDECSDASLNNCADSTVAKCWNTHGSFGCQCTTGYYGDGRLCEDINECTNTPSPCHEHANCNNTIGSFTCTCKNGYHGNGLHCEGFSMCNCALRVLQMVVVSLSIVRFGRKPDICTTSLDSNLCREVKHLDQQNKQLQKKLDQRDRQMSRLLNEVHSMAKAFRAYHTDISRDMNDVRSTLDAENDRLREDVRETKSELQQTKSELQQTRSELQETKAMVTNNKAALIASNAMVMDTKAKMNDNKASLIDTKAMVNDNKAALIDTKAMVNDNKAALIDTKAMVNDTKSDLLSTISTMATKSQLHTCGIVAWKTFRKETGTRNVYPMNVIYNKTRADTVLRVMYTATFGTRHHSSWTTFTISILINNTDCQDPGPIRSGVSGIHTGNGNVYTILPGAISGVCHINTAGPLRITTKLAVDSGSFKYEGTYSSSSSRITSSLHVEELCANSNA